MDVFHFAEGFVLRPSDHEVMLGKVEFLLKLLTGSVTAIERNSTPKEKTLVLDVYEMAMKMFWPANSHLGFMHASGRGTSRLKFHSVRLDAALGKFNFSTVRNKTVD